MIRLSRLVKVLPFTLGFLFAAALFISQGSITAAASPANTATTSATSLQQRIVQIALSYRGYRYVSGGSSPSTGFDCSGFAWWVYRQAGINFGRGSAASYVRLGQAVSRANLQPGDMVLYANTYKPGVSHVEIYIGNGQTIGADNPQVGVVVNNLNASYWVAHYYSARRLVNGTSSGSNAGTAPSSPTKPAAPPSSPGTSSTKPHCAHGSLHYRYYWWRVWTNGHPHTYYRYYWWCS
ncbi:MAG TPA: C40 family peptidase [Ktedonobacterales bacterium]